MKINHAQDYGKTKPIKAKFKILRHLLTELEQRMFHNGEINSEVSFGLIQVPVDSLGDSPYLKALLRLRQSVQRCHRGGRAGAPAGRCYRSASGSRCDRILRTG